jgi:hypothetical protein
MYQSSARKNFLDILSDPTAIAILASVALHAAIGSTFPFFTQPEKAGTKAGPTTVKVVELTPGELQRIPQAPKPKPVVPPVTQPIPIKRSTTPPPRTPQFSNSPQAIPFSPFGNPAATATPKPAKTKQPKTVRQPAQPVFDPNIFTEPKPTKSPVATATKPKPVVKPTPAAKPQPKKPKVATSPSPQPDQPMDWNGDGQEPVTPTTTSPQAQKPTVTPKPSTAPTVTPTTQPTTQPTGDPNGGSAGNGFYGKYTDAAINQLQVYMKEFGVKELPASRKIVRSYPQGMLCSKEKQTPFIVMMAVFDKFPDSVDSAILGNSSAPALKISTFKDRDTPEQKQLAEIATRAALEEASKADQNRSANNKNQRVIYQYRVEFDPATCKKN